MPVASINDVLPASRMPTKRIGRAIARSVLAAVADAAAAVAGTARADR